MGVRSSYSYNRMCAISCLSGGNSCTGSVRLEQQSPDHPTVVHIRIQGLPPGAYELRVHNYGDESFGKDSPMGCIPLDMASDGSVVMSTTQASMTLNGRHSIMDDAVAVERIDDHDTAAADEQETCMMLGIIGFAAPF
ncbi:hypothetical protein BC831DRAFT_511970 [Entophlyctis helioformis]|nr:hypothetical protein BC831DRAFT_511970 [Entophlyctis helioformis]